MFFVLLDRSGSRTNQSTACILKSYNVYRLFLAFLCLLKVSTELDSALSCSKAVLYLIQLFSNAPHSGTPNGDINQFPLK